MSNKAESVNIKQMLFYLSIGFAEEAERLRDEDIQFAPSSYVPPTRWVEQLDTRTPNDRVM